MEFPPVLYYYLWFAVVLNFCLVYKVFATKPEIRSVKRQQLTGVLGLVIGFFFLVYLMGWVK